ncbi:DMT family transporter [Acuticoccus mangrovi]|uniref:EamA family transporter n=1 Tax=Acuticoccus mangrovi TaxID=2796142 RepID=A0A934IPD8_9HYPH|nr:DMT family transporter [Acuticoccus mangrovi]MBJ3776211.1 EamA family transporter [Acuticoccus mangrovi]
MTAPFAARLGAPVRFLANQPYILLALTMFFWASNMVVGRGVAGQIPPIFLAQARWLLAGLIILPFGWHHIRRDFKALRQRWKAVLILAILGITVYNTLLYVGLRSTTAVNANVLSSMFPLTIAALGFLLYRDRLTLAQFLGIAAACVGAAVILSGGQLQRLLEFRFTPGDLWVIGAQICYAGYTVVLRERPAVHPIAFLTATINIGAVLLIPFTLAEAAVSDIPVSLDGTTLLTVAYLALFPSIGAYICFNRGVGLVGSNRASPFFHLMPVFGSLMAVGFLGETIGLHHAIGWLLIVGGIAAAQMGRRDGAVRFNKAGTD